MPTVRLRWLLPLLAFAFAAGAQQPCYLTLNRQKGLPSDEVYNVYQDTKGYIWLATGEGLCRYDGFDFVSYKSEGQTSLHGSCIQEDKYGRIWYENFDSYLYYTDSGKLKSLNQGAPFYYVPFGISKQHLFVTTSAGVKIYDISTLKLVKTITIPTQLSIHAAGAANSYYVVTNNTLYRIGDDLTIRSATLVGRTQVTDQNVFACGGGVFVATVGERGKTLYRYNEQLELEQTIPIPTATVIQSGAYIDGMVYINTPTGCLVYNTADTTVAGSGQYFKGKSISGVLKDRQHNFWFPTTNEGLYIVPDINNKIFALPGYAPSRLVPATDGYYVGTQTGELLHVSPGFDKLRLISSSPSSKAIYYLYADREQVMYSSTGFTTLPVAGRTVGQNSPIPVKQITRLDEKYYAFASSVYCGLLRTPGYTKSAPSIWDGTFAKGNKNSLPGIASIINIVRAKSVAYDTQSRRIFFATNRGVYSVNPDTVVELTNNGHRLFANSLEVAYGYLYSLTPMGVVLRLPSEGNGLATILPIKNVSLMKRFGYELYLFGGGALHKLHLPSGKLKRVEVSMDIYGLNDLLLHNGQLLLVTNEGIIAVGKDTARHRKQALFYINSITANNKAVDSKRLLELAYNENNISVSFSFLDFGMAIPAALYYQLNDGGWKELPKESRLLQFPSLSPGIYTLRFSQRQATEIGGTVSFYIKPAYWQQWWFYLLCLLLVVALVLGYYKKQIGIRIKKLEAQREKMQLEQDLGKSMLTSIRAQMNPHFFYNALNTIQAYIFTNDKARASSYLAKFSRLTRTILEMSESETVALSQEAETIKLYLELEKMRFDGSFEYEIEFIGIDNKETIEIPSMIIQPYVENAIKHGLLHKSGNKLLQIRCEQVHHVLWVTIDDNGIGRKQSEQLHKIKAEKYRSFSTKANEKRLELLNKGRSEKIIVEIIDKMAANGYADGTRVIVTIPI